MLGFSPLLLLLVSLIVGASQRRHAVFAAVGFITAGAVVAVLNFYLSFIRPRIYWSRHGSKDGYRFVSGMPIIGTVLTLLGAVFGFGAVGIAVVGIGAFALDTGGSGWFVVLTWRDRSFWDA
jgi:uncharacterized RDD family membrane protein YckC